MFPRFLSSIHRRIAGHRAGRHRRRRPDRRPSDRTRARFRLEGLEDRCLLSGISAITEFPSPAVALTTSRRDHDGARRQPLVHRVRHQRDRDDQPDHPRHQLVHHSHRQFRSRGDHRGPRRQHLVHRIPAANAIGMINPTTHAITEFTLPTANAGPDAITAGPDGNLWFTEDEPTRSARSTRPPTPSPSSPPRTSATGPIRHHGRPRRQPLVHRGRRRQRSVRSTRRPTPSPSSPSASDSRPDGITAGPDGNLWFTEPAPTRSVRSTRRPTPSPSSPRPPSGRLGITAGPDGNLWFTEDTR